MLPHRQCQHDRNFLEHKRLDEEAGIQTKAYYVGELITSLALPNSESLDFGIWDDTVCCSGIYSKGGPFVGISEWKVSQREEDLQLFREMARVLREKGQLLTNNTGGDEIDLEEPMITTAPLVYELAPVLCQGDHVSSENCSWYHSIWQYLRIFDMVSTPTWHEDFYKSSLKKIADSGSKEVLVSGTADYSVLAHVLWAFSGNKNTANVSVLDLCETPLFLCKWYAKLVGFKINTLAIDLFNYEPTKAVELITTDAFLTRFSPNERPRIVKKSFDLLAKGGKVVTTVRIEPGLVDELVGSTDEQIKAFRNKAKKEALRWQEFLGHSVEEIANSAQLYAENMVSYSIPSESLVRELFEDAGFVLEQFDLANVRGEMKQTIYSEIVAVKP